MRPSAYHNAPSVMTCLEELEHSAACLLGEDMAGRAQLANDIASLLKGHDR